MARFPKYEPTDEQRRQVLTMVGLGIKYKDIANLIGCDPKTLRLHYQRELDTGETEANMRVAQALYNNAVKHNNITAQIWWTKSRMGWKDTAPDLTNGDTSLTMLHLIAARQVAEQMQALLAAGVKPDSFNGNGHGNGKTNGHSNGNGHTIDGVAIDYTKPALE